jgi:uncharacterized protein YutE (UPF0331/DUF86 family)
VKNPALNRALVEDRLRFIERSVESLHRFKGLSLDEFSADPDFFRIAYYDLYTALEACLDIGAHILSRIPNFLLSSEEIPGKKPIRKKKKNSGRRS